MNEEVIARMMNYYKGNSNNPDIKSLKDDVNKCILAQEFLDHDLTDEFYIFEDLKKWARIPVGKFSQRFIKD